MIKVTTEKENDGNVIMVRIEGDVPTIMPEVCRALARGVEDISEATGDTQVEATLYATIRGAIFNLENDGHKINRNRLGFALMEK